MEELESQIAKIQLGNTKSSQSYVYTLAEKAQGSDAELFVVAELPLFNPAAESSCEKICLAIGSTLKRVFRRPADAVNFEIAVSQINEELGKLASLGQTHWIDKLNCILAVKDNKDLHIATCGKIAAFLLRGGEFTDISCSPAQSHPLKTFENYASGKIRLNDLIILSTTQLFNYLSMDRLKHILDTTNFLNATQTIIELLKENAGPEVAFATVLNLQVSPGQATEEDVDLENYVVEEPAGSISLWNKAYNYIVTAFIPTRKNRESRVSLPKVGLGQRLEKFKGKTKKILEGGKTWWYSSKSLGRSATKNLDVKNFKSFSREKKFFFISVCVLLITCVITITVAQHSKKIRQKNDAVIGQLKEVQSLLSNAQSSLLYHDEKTAADYFKQAKGKLPASGNTTAATADAYKKITDQIADLQNKLEKNTPVDVTVIGNLGQGDNLIKLPEYLATGGRGGIVSYNEQTGNIEDSALKSGMDIKNNVYAAKTSAVIYDGGKLYVWDYKTGQTGAGFSVSVPSQNNEAGLAFYSTNNRAYLIDKQNAQVTSFLTGTNALSKPVVTVKDSSLGQATDLTIDGSIYVLKNDGGIVKFQAGKLADFSISAMSKGLSGKGKIYTQKDFKNIYVLDAGNNRIVVFDKRGVLVSTLSSDKFNNLKDFEVDEKNKTIYVLSDSTLLKINF